MRRLPVALACCAILYAAACSLGTVLQPTPDLSNFYVLTPLDQAARGTPITYSSNRGPQALDIGLGPVKFPAYLARLEIVTRSSPNQLDVSPLNRWAEPLDKNFTNVLGQNLMTLLGAHVTTFPWYRPVKLDYQVTLDITRFDTDSQKTARVIGRWEIKDPKSGDLLNSGEINLTEASEKDESTAATLSRALGDVSTQLADAIRATKPPASGAKTD
jgi:uncharacterized lipoprotein YmbA